MKKRLTILFLLTGLAGGITCQAQNATVSYAYDACGNRVQRTLGFKKAEKNEYASDDDGKGWQASVVDTFGTAGLSLYPNPTEGRFSLAFTETPSAPMQTRLCTVGGAVIETRTITNAVEEFDLTDKPAGIYLLRLEAGGETQTWKIIKKN